MYAMLGISRCFPTPSKVCGRLQVVSIGLTAHGGRSQLVRECYGIKRKRSLHLSSRVRASSYQSTTDGLHMLIPCTSTMLQKTIVLK
jgi:hypothetical protein